MSEKLLDKEKIKESISYSPILFGKKTLLIESPFEKREYKLTDKRLIQESKGLFNEGYQDLSLDEIVSINYNKTSTKVLIAAATVALIAQVPSLLLSLLLDPQNPDIGPALGLLILPVGLYLISFGLLLYYTVRSQDYIPISIVILSQIFISPISSFAAFGNALLIIVGFILGVSIPIIVLLYAVYATVGSFKIQSSNPDASISFPGSRRNNKVENFVQSVRKSAEDRRDSDE